MLRLSRPPALDDCALTQSQPEVGSCSVPRRSWTTQHGPLKTGRGHASCGRADLIAMTTKWAPSRPQAVGINQAQNGAARPPDAGAPLLKPSAAPAGRRPAGGSPPPDSG